MHEVDQFSVEPFIAFTSSRYICALVSLRPSCGTRLHKKSSLLVVPRHPPTECSTGRMQSAEAAFNRSAVSTLSRSARALRQRSIPDAFYLESVAGLQDDLEFQVSSFFEGGTNCHEASRDT